MSTVTITVDDVDGIPALHAEPAERAGEPLPTVFFFHGYRSSKEISLFFAYMLAQAGLRAVMPEADMHGARYDGDDARRLGCFWDILKRNVDELPRVRAHYEDRGLIDAGRIGVGGTSMGGFAALASMARYPWVRATASYMGSGYFMDLSRQVFPPSGSFHAGNRDEHLRRLAPLADYDIGHQLERLGDRPLFLWHGAKDEIVPVGESLRLIDALVARGQSGLLEAHIDAQAEHKVTMTAATQGVEFFRRELLATVPR